MTDDQITRARTMVKMGRSVKHVAAALTAPQKLVREAVRDLIPSRTLICKWCNEKFLWQPQPGRPPGFCCDLHRRYDEEERRTPKGLAA
jgi:hypothetical protein